MLQKCANPGCSTPFRFLRTGKLFRVHIDSEGDIQIVAVARTRPLRNEYFWLCQACSAQVQIRFDAREGLIVAPLARSRAAAGGP